MKQTLDITISAVVRRTITIDAWDMAEAEDDATEIFEAGISGEYDVTFVEIEEVVGGGLEEVD